MAFHNLSERLDSRHGRRVRCLAVWHALMEHAGTLSLIVSTRDAASGDMDGSWLHATHTFWVRLVRSRADTVAAILSHELAHAVTCVATATMDRAGMAAIHLGVASLIDAIEAAMVDAEEVRLAA